MKKLLVGSLLLCGLVAQAQQLTGDGVTIENDWDKTFLYHTQGFSEEFVLCRVEYGNTGATVTVFDSSLSPNRSFSIPGIVYTSSETEGKNEIRVLVGWDVDEAGTGSAEEWEVFPATLFNDDSSIEYGVGTFTRQAVEGGYGYVLTKIEIYSESGKLLGSLPSDLIDLVKKSAYFTSTGVDVYKLGTDDFYLHYLVKVGYDYVSDVFWKINRGESGAVSFAKAAAFKGYPNPVGGGETFTVEVPAERLGAVNRVEVRDSAGRLVATCPVQDGKAQFPTRGLKGVCVYTVIADGSPVDSGKVIVK